MRLIAQPFVSTHFKLYSSFTYCINTDTCVCACVKRTNLNLRRYFMPILYPFFSHIFTFIICYKQVSCLLMSSAKECVCMRCQCTNRSNDHWTGANKQWKISIAIYLYSKTNSDNLKLTTRLRFIRWGCTHIHIYIYVNAYMRVCHIPCKFSTTLVCYAFTLPVKRTKNYFLMSKQLFVLITYSAFIIIIIVVVYY